MLRMRACCLACHVHVIVRLCPQPRPTFCTLGPCYHSLALALSAALIPRHLRGQHVVMHCHQESEGHNTQRGHNGITGAVARQQPRRDRAFSAPLRSLVDPSLPKVGRRLLLAGTRVLSCLALRKEAPIKWVQIVGPTQCGRHHLLVAHLRSPSDMPFVGVDGVGSYHVPVGRRLGPCLARGPAS